MERPSRINSGFVVGGIFASLLIITHLIVDMVNSWNSQADIVLWIVQLVCYFIAALVASNSQYQRQVNNDDPFVGVVSAGRGAAMIIAVCMWIYIIVRTIVLNIVDNEFGLFAGIGVILFVGFMVLDFFLAIALATGGGAIIEKQHNRFAEE